MRLFNVVLIVSRLAGPDIRLGGEFNIFPVSHICFFVGGGKVYSQTGWGTEGNGRIFPLDSSLIVRPLA